MTTKILRSALRSLALLFILMLSVLPLRSPHPASFENYDAFPYAAGSASEVVRTEIIHQLREFQKGYAERDTASAGEFAEHLLSQDNVLILGTMPREIYVGHSAATNLIREDWASWGDCTFLLDKAHVSAHGDVAWFSTVGYVEFDLSRFLVLPLRLTGVAVNEDGTWRFHQIQYQFDLDLSFNLLLVFVVLVLSASSVLVLIIQIARAAMMRRQAS
jgi:hypothetical protein